MVAFPGAGTFQGAGEIEDAHLEREQKKKRRTSPHRGEGGDDQGDEGRNKRVDFHAGHGKEHAPPLVIFFTMLMKINIAVKG